MSYNATPAGWYPDPADPDNSIRYWDGEVWTESTAPAQNDTPGSDGPTADQQAQGAGYQWAPAPGSETGPPWSADDAQYSQPGPTDHFGGQQDDDYASAPRAGGDDAGARWRTADEPRPESRSLKPASGRAGPLTKLLAAVDGLHVGRRARSALVGVAVVVVLLVGIGSALGGAPASTKWFAGGLPKTWTTATEVKYCQYQDVKAAWAVGGDPVFGTVRPAVSLSEYNQVAPATLSGTSLLTWAVSACGFSRLTNPAKLANGAPAVTANFSAPDSRAPGVPVHEFVLAAFYDNHIYMAVFETDAAQYQAELPAVKAALGSFDGQIP